MLARLRFPNERSRGRRYPETRHPYRGEYQRDRDRVLHSRAFRRLQYKTQVFTAPNSDHLRNRLTHTIEVSQITRTVAKVLELNEELVEALALTHDIGHPPFGHSGEAVLDFQMRKYGGRFDHNLHALRIVEQFEHRYANFRGLNLTFEVREGIVKHSSDYSANEFPDLAEYLLDQQPPLEAQLLDPADEITYNCADLDDAIDAGLLSTDQVREQVSFFGRCLTQAERTFPNAAPKIAFHEALRALYNAFVEGLIEGTRGAAERSGLESADDVRCCPNRLAGLDPELTEASQQLRAVLWRDVYQSPRLAAEQNNTSDKLSRLFEFFMQQPAALPRAYLTQAEEEPLHRIVCDYLAGMTDTFLLKTHEQLLEAP